MPPDTNDFTVKETLTSFVADYHRDHEAARYETQEFRKDLRDTLIRIHDSNEAQQKVNMAWQEAHQKSDNEQFDKMRNEISKSNGWRSALVWVLGIEVAIAGVIATMFKPHL